MSTVTDAEMERFAELQRMAIEAARTGDIEMLRPMLDAGMPVELRDAKANTLLMLAAYHGNTSTVDLLLERGAAPDARNDRGQTPLAGVAFKGHLEIARRLIAAGADPAADQGGGRTPVMFAAMFGQPEMVQLLERAVSPISGKTKSSLARLAGLMAVPRKLLAPDVWRRIVGYPHRARFLWNQ